MEDTIVEIQISDIVLDDRIYPRENIDHKRVLIFVENLRDGFEFDPIQIQLCPNPDLSEKKASLSNRCLLKKCSSSLPIQTKVSLLLLKISIMIKILLFPNI